MSAHGRRSRVGRGSVRGVAQSARPSLAQGALPAEAPAKWHSSRPRAQHVEDRLGCRRRLPPRPVSTKRPHARARASSSTIPPTPPAPRSSARSTPRPSAPSMASATSSARRGAGSRDRGSSPTARLLPALARASLSGRHAVSRLSRSTATSSRSWASRRTASRDIVSELRQLVSLKDDGGFELDLSYFRHWSDGVEMTWDEGEPTIGTRVHAEARSAARAGAATGGAARRAPRSIAASLQAVYEEAALHVLRHVQRATGATRLCLAGGCAMNSVANGKIRERTPFREVFIQPAAGDNGTALGAAFHAWHARSGAARVRDGARLLGPRVLGRRDRGGARRRGERRSSRTAARGARCDDADAIDAGPPRRSPTAASSAGFRDEWSGAPARSATAASSPIRGAPTCARSSTRGSSSASASGRSRRRCSRKRVDEYFVGAVADPFMLQVYPVRPDKRAIVPAITHVDGSGRLQTVSERTNPRYRQLIDAFARIYRRADAAEYVVQRERADRAAAGAKRSTAFSARTWTCW